MYAFFEFKLIRYKWWREINKDCKRPWKKRIRIYSNSKTI